MRARLSDFKRQSSCGARARVLGQVRDCRNEGGDGTHFSERQQRLLLQTLSHTNVTHGNSVLRRGERTSMGLRRSRSSSSALMTRDMKGDRMVASRVREGEERGGEEDTTAAAPPPAAGTPAPAPPPAAASDDFVAGREGAAGDASASSSFLRSLASPKARPMLLRSSRVMSTATLSVIFSFL